MAGVIIKLTMLLKQPMIMIEEGADLIDIGGESSKPGALASKIELKNWPG